MQQCPSKKIESHGGAEWKQVEETLGIANKTKKDTGFTHLTET
jgi:hypothetical protein